MRRFGLRARIAAGCILAAFISPPAAAEPSDYALAKRAVEAQQFKRAEALLRTWLYRHSADQEARFWLARVYGRQGKYGLAIGEYDRLLEREPDNSDYLLGKAQTLVWEGRLDSALPILERARRLTPDYEDVWCLHIQTLRAAGREIEAMALSNAAMKRFPKATWTEALPSPEKADSGSSTPRIPPPEQGAAGAAGTSERTEIELGGSYENLDSVREFANWSSVYLQGVHQIAEHHTFYGAIRQADRFSREDSDFMAGLSFPLSERWTATAEAGGSPTHQFLAQWWLSGQLHYRFDGGYGMQFGFRHSAYNETDVRIGSWSLERYFGNFRAAYTIYIGVLDDSAPTFSHFGQLTYYYADHSHIGVGYATGQETVRLAPGRIENADIQSIALIGQHWLNAHWAISYEIGLAEQGSSYTREGGRLGIRYLF